MTDELISFAQNTEDIVLNAFLKDVKKGFYVDVGANHPVHDSVTKLFYLKGWDGINIEPLGRLYKLLAADRPRDINLNLGVSNHEDELVIREYGLGHGLSTFSKDIQEDYKKTNFFYAKDYVDQKVPVTTLAKLLSEHAKDKKIDFLKIDVEGYEYEVIESNDWDKFRPSIICIEANHILKDWHPLLKKYKYTLAYFDGLNEYFVADENKSIKKDFSYPDLFVAPYITWQNKKDYIDLNRKIRQETFKYEMSQETVNNQRVINLIPSPQRFRSVIKNTLLFLNGQLNRYYTQDRFIKHTKGQSLSQELNLLSSSQAIQLLQVTMQTNSDHAQSFRFKLAKSLYFGLKRLAKVTYRSLRS